MTVQVTYNTHWSGEIAAKDMPPTSIGRIVAPQNLRGTIIRHDISWHGFQVWHELNRKRRLIAAYGDDVRVTCIDRVTLDRDGTVLEEVWP